MSSPKEHVQDVVIQAAVFTVSTTRTTSDDESGKMILSSLAKADAPVVQYQIVPDEREAIRNALEGALSSSNCIIFTGGTGLTPDDVTIEAVCPYFDKTVEGFGELFRHLSYEEIGTRSLLSRAVAGTIRNRVIFCIPGSLPAVILAMEKLIIPELKHILTHIGAPRKKTE